MTEEKSSLEHITLSQFDLEETLKLANEQGVVIIPNYVSCEELEALNNEFDLLIEKVPNGEKIKPLLACVIW